MHTRTPPFSSSRKDVGVACAGEEGGEGAAVPESLPEFVVQLDEKFVAELARIAASYDDLFSQKGRQKLTQVMSNLAAIL